MTQPAPLAIRTRSAASNAITADRQETKYVVAQAQSQRLLRALEAHLPAHRYLGEGGNRLPGARHFITTVYFDTPSLALLRAALDAPWNNLKVRVRQYYDFHPGLVEVATHASQLLRYQPVLWLETKRRTQARTQKLRHLVSAADVPCLLGQPKVPLRSPTLAAVAAEIHQQCQNLGEPLRESCVVHYQRVPFQNAEATLRVTLDFGLKFYAPPPDLWSSEGPLQPSRLGQARAGEPCVLVEVKSQTDCPSWLETALADVGATASAYSKFVQAGRVVHGVA